MAKLYTAQMEKQHRTMRVRRSSLWRDAVARLMKSKGAVFGLAVVVSLIVCALFPEQLAPYHYDLQNYSEAFTAPCWEHPLGTDNFGRDILSRIIYGARVSVQVGLISVSLATLFGMIFGSLAAFYGGWVDGLIMRTLDILNALPSFLLSISISSALGPGLFNLMLAVGIGSIPGYARIIRASLMAVKEEEYIEAARSIGASNARLILRHMLPNAFAPVVVQATLGVGGAIMSGAALSFLGLGIQPPTPEWGYMLNAGRNYIRDYPHIVLFPGLTIMLVVFALNLFGDGLRDALDPRLKQ